MAGQHPKRLFAESRALPAHHRRRRRSRAPRSLGGWRRPKPHICVDAQINDRGFYTDAVLLAGAIRITETAGASINTELRDLTGISSVNATSQILRWLKEHGYELTDLRRKTIRAALA